MEELIFSYNLIYPEFRASYSTFIIISQILSVLLITLILFPSNIREKTAPYILSLLWLLVGINYYGEMVKGLYGRSMEILCIVESVLLIVNLEQLLYYKLPWIGIKYWEYLVNFSSPNTVFCSISAFIMIVTITQILPRLFAEESPQIPTPHLLGAFSYNLMCMLEVSLPNYNNSLSLIRYIHVTTIQFTLVTKIPLVICLLETSVASLQQGAFGGEQTLILISVIISYTLRLSPVTELKRARNKRPVIEERKQGDGGTQGIISRQYEDSDGDRADEFYVHHGAKLMKIPENKLKRIS